MAVATIQTCLHCEVPISKPQARGSERVLAAWGKAHGIKDPEQWAEDHGPLCRECLRDTLYKVFL